MVVNIIKKLILKFILKYSWIIYDVIAYLLVFVQFDA